MLRKCLSMLLIAALSGALLLSGCAKADAGKKAEVQTPAAQTPAAQPEKKPTLRYLMGSPLAGTTYNDYILSKQLAEKTGYKVEYEALPADKPQDKLNLLIASGESYDIVSTGWNFMSLFYRFAEQGALADLDELIEKYGKNIKAQVSAETLDRLKVNNKRYGIGTLKAYGTDDKIYVFGGLAVRQDWMEQLGLQDPKTLDEFTKLLETIKQKDPGKNGANNIPLTLRAEEVSMPGMILPGVAGAFGIANEWIDVGGKLVNRVEHPGFKEYLAYLNSLYNKGLIDKDFGVNKVANAEEKYTSGKAGIMQIGWSTVPRILDATIKNFPQAKIKFLSPPAGKDGKRGYSMFKGELDRITFIPKASKNAADAVKYLDLLLDKDIFRYLALGEEGKHFTVQDGNYMPINPLFNDERNNSNVYLVGLDEKNFPRYWLARLRKDARLPGFYNELHVNLKTLLVQDPMAPMPYLPEVIKSGSVMAQTVNDYALKVVMGVEKIDEIDNFVKKWKADGGDKVTKEVNDWYAKNKK